MIKTKLLLGLLCCFLSLFVQTQRKEFTLIPDNYISIKKGDTLAIRQLQNESTNMTMRMKKDMLIYAAYTCFTGVNSEKPTLDFWLQQTEGMSIDDKDFKSNKYLDAVTSERMKREVLRYIDKRRRQLAEERIKQQKAQERKQAELREQDSLRHLMETGNYDKKKWVFNSSFRAVINNGVGTTTHWISVSPRIDYISNKVGEENEWLLGLLAAVIAAVFIFIMSKHALASMGKENGKSELLIYLGILQCVALYMMFACVYSDIDELMVRSTGKEYIAQYKYDNFCFVTSDSIAVEVSQGECTFDWVGQGTEVPVRYDEATMKLAVDMQKYTLRNWNWILFISLLLLLNLLLCYGKFNWIFKKIFRNRTTVHDSPYQKYIYFPWHFKNKKYETFDQFKKELEHFRFEWDEIDEDNKIYETPRILIRYNKEYAEKPVKFEFEIRPDNGESIRMDQWMYKLQNELVPYMERLGEPDTMNGWIHKGWTAGKEMICDLSCCSSLDDDDVLFADIAWKFTETEYTDYRTFIHDVMAFQTEHGKHFWNPDVIVVKQPSFTLCYYNPRTGHLELYDMEADNGVTLTEGEILYKLHNQMRDVLPGQEFCYLQYLVFRPVEADSLEELEEKQKDKDIYDLFTTNEI